MKIHVKKSRLAGAIAVPGSKSHTIRAIAAALMAEGESIIRAPLVSADTLATLRAAGQLGAVVRRADGLWRITGCGGRFTPPQRTIDMENSGTGLRLLSALAATQSFPVAFDGDASLRSRPMGPLLAALAELGVAVESDDGRCPLRVRGPLRGGRASVEAVSSQFLSALLFAAPLALAPTALDLTLLNERPYVEITLKWLDRLGVRYRASADRMHYELPGNQKIGAFDVTIPADFSTAAFPLGAAALVGDGVDILNLDFQDVQGDKAVFDMFEAMGAKVERREKVTRVTAGRPLNALTLDLNATPDALPLLAVTAALTPGETRLVNVPQARLKETDRICCMCAELKKMGGEVEELPDGMIIRGGKLTGAALKSYGDHRIVMALAVAALAADGESVIDEAEAAAVTYPDFVADFQRLGADITVIKD